MAEQGSYGSALRAWRASFEDALGDGVRPFDGRFINAYRAKTQVHERRIARTATCNPAKS